MVLASVALLRRYLTPRVPQRRRVLLAVAAADIPFQGTLVYRELQLALLRDEGGYYALSLLCTHLGCIVNVTPEHFSCPCHGSHFDRRGNVLKGPADRPLRRLAVEQREGMIEVLAG